MTMNKKEKLIIGIITSELKGIKKMLKDQNKQIKDIDKNGFDKEIHPGWHMDIKTGLSYTQGYCTGYIAHAEKFIELLNLKDEKEVEKLIEENKAIEKANKAEMKRVFDSVKERIKKKSNDNKKKSKT